VEKNSKHGAFPTEITVLTLLNGCNLVYMEAIQQSELLLVWISTVKQH
jgi:hypothetical protein